MATLPDPYATLGVDRDATAADIKHAYRVLVRTHHPDVAGDAVTKNGPTLLQIYCAYALLSDSQNRARYDQQHPAPRRDEPSASSSGTPPIRFGPVHWTPSRSR
ncbi:DnaJ domain-containing protein [Smaragdicoccus niigatensis]|uniref:DnaJ domain-containing protein n=1 Tax=Smaragdicoccus niigatensis TaxID=359359 RepID=UPI0009DBCC36|nr:DnaJ domain-containing protein [Smaragdicoccus niigatensis]